MYPLYIRVKLWKTSGLLFHRLNIISSKFELGNFNTKKVMNISKSRKSAQNGPISAPRGVVALEVNGKSLKFSQLFGTIM